jgi:hypothetical protein
VSGKGEAELRAMLAADRAFFEALIDAYGRRASEMRYRTAKHPPNIRALGDAYEAAADAWRKLYAGDGAGFTLYRCKYGPGK